ncbi:MAG: zf-HC2 domain-containing protein [Bacillota bacterium]|nr:zf-HC2 domain-containing protein [Bacillota bacterium]MDI7249275.1 zf-HC2 domain-containing protein [Bacillota bacterium]
MNCHEVTTHLVAYLDGELSQSEKQVIRDHLRGCRRCQDQVTELLEVRRLVTRSLARRAAHVSAPTGAWEHLRDRLRPRQPHGLCDRLQHRLRLPRWWPVLAALLLATSAVGTLQLSAPAALRNLGQVVGAWWDGARQPGFADRGMQSMTILKPAYLPPSRGTVLSGMVSEDSARSVSQTYLAPDWFVQIRQISPTTDWRLPAGRTVRVLGQQAVLVSGGKVKLARLVMPEGFHPGTPLFSPEVTYSEAKQLVFVLHGTRVEILSDLPEEELLRVASSLTAGVP